MSENNKKPETFDEYKKEMKKHWKEVIIPPQSQIEKSTNFFKKNINIYATNCLFLELLEFQFYLKEKMKQTNFIDYFKKPNGKKLQNEDFPFVIPFMDENYLTTFENKNVDTKFQTYYIKEDIEKFVKNPQPKENLVQFLKENPDFDYYFWNVTFPNMFCGFLSCENCSNAVNFLNYFEDKYKDIFIKGARSFIVHNYYFQDSFLKSFFVNYQKEEEDIKILLQNSLKKAVQKLNIHQLDFLSNFIDKHPEEAKKMFLNDIILRSIELWKYSPINSPFIKIKDENNEIALITNIKKLYIKDQENAKTNLEDLLTPIFTHIKKKISINEIYINNLIIDERYNICITFLDALIITKAVAIKGQIVFFEKYYEKLSPRYLLSKAYSFAYVPISAYRNEPFFSPEKPPEFDKNHVTQWKEYVANCKKHNRNPLEVFYDDEKEPKIYTAPSPEVASVGIQLSYYDWLNSNNVKVILKRESRVLIPLKAIIDSTNSFIEIFTYYTTSSNIYSNTNFKENIKGLYVTNIVNFSMKAISRFYKIKSPYKRLIKNKKEKLNNTQEKGLIDKINKEIANLENEEKEKYTSIYTQSKNELTIILYQNFDNIFNHDDSYLRVSQYYSTYSTKFKKDFLNSTTRADPSEEIVKSFKIILKYLEYFARAQLILFFNERSEQLARPKTELSQIPDSNIDSFNTFDSYSQSGIFKYIKDLLSNYEERIQESKDLAIGDVFAAVPVINRILRQFEGQNGMSIQLGFGISSDNIMINVLAYPFLSTVDNPEQKINEMQTLFLTAHNALSPYENLVPYFTQLQREIELILKYLHTDYSSEKGNE